MYDASKYERLPREDTNSEVFRRSSVATARRLASPTVSLHETPSHRAFRPVARPRVEPLVWLLVGRLARLISAAVALSFIASFARIALQRVGYPFELEWMEGGALEHVQRLLDGQPLYVPPSVDFTPYIYPPLYSTLGAVFSQILGPGFMPLRLLSALCALGNLALISALVWRETRDAWSACIAAGVFAATFHLSGGWFDLARVDSLFLCLLLAVVHTLRRSRAVRYDVIAGLLGGAAFLAKQSTFVALGPLALYSLLAGRGTRRWAFALTLGMTTACSTLLLQLLTHGWFSYYVFSLLADHNIESGMYLGFWRQDLFGPLLLPCVLACCWVLWTLANKPWLGAFWMAVCCGLLGCAWSSRLHTGGYLNVLMPAHAILAIGAGMGVATLCRTADSSKRAALQTALSVGFVIQFSNLTYNPDAFVPTEEDRATGEAIVRELRATPQTVWIPGAPYLLRMAGKPSHAHQMALLDVLRSTGPEAIALKRQLDDAIASGRFGKIVTLDGWLYSEILRHYRPAGRLQPNSHFLPVTGMRKRISEVLECRSLLPEPHRNVN